MRIKLFKYWDTGYFLLLAIAILYLFSFLNRYTNADEGVIAEWAYWLLNGGVVKSHLYEPYNIGLEHHTIIYHKLLVWIGAAVISIFGFELLPLKLILFVCLILLSYFIYRYTIKNGRQGSLLFILALSMLALNARIFEFSGTFRPEVLVAFLGFASFYYLINNFKSSNSLDAIFAGAFAGLAFLGHLNGIAYCISGFVLLLLNSKYKSLIYYSLSGGIISAFYFIDILSPDAFEMIFSALKLSPEHVDTQPTIGSIFLKIVNENQRFFHSPIEISLTVTLIVALILGGKYLYRNQKPLLVYTILLFLILGAITHGKTPKYFILYLPFLTLIIAQITYQFIKHKPLKARIISIFIAGYFIVQVLGIIQIYKKHFNLNDLNAKVSAAIPKGSKIMAYNNLVFDGIEKYYITSESTFDFIYKANGWQLELDDYLDFAYNNHNEYVVLTPTFSKASYFEVLKPETSQIGKIYRNYKVIQASPDMVILKSQHK